MEYGQESPGGRSEIGSLEANQGGATALEQESGDRAGSRMTEDARSSGELEIDPGSSRGWHKFDAPSVFKLLGRIVVFMLLVGIVYAVVRQLSYLIFAPELSVESFVPPPRTLKAGEPVTLGVVVRNESLMSGAAFVVAAFGDGVEVEGPTLDVPAKDKALIPVLVTLPPGESVLSLVVFDGWRGVRRLRTLRGITISVGDQEVDPANISMPGQITRGDTITVSFPWINLGVVEQLAVPSVIFRPQGGGPPIFSEGEPTALAPRERVTLVFAADSWPLEPGRYSAEVQVRSPAGSRLGRGTAPSPLNVTPP